MVPNIEEMVIAQLEEIERLKKAMEVEDSYSAFVILERKLADAEKSLEGHTGRIRKIKIDKLID